jgi:phosphopantothenoylcysteine decarboxylase/phosphopantothenate--cysteine ligase
MGVARLSKKCVVLGVTGGIAAYKAVELARRLTQEGYRVKTVMTEHATQLVTPLTFRTVTGEEVGVSLFASQSSPVYHITLAREADVVVVAPATANIIAKMAVGIADDLLSTTLLSTTAPIVLAPAMNTSMLEHPATRENLRVLRERGVTVVGPASGSLACGEEGEGRMVEPEEILRVVREKLGGGNLLQNVRILITAGGTREPIDAVRFIGNYSSGKMGFALAEEARDWGASVTLISGPTLLEPPEGMRFFQVQTAEEMYHLVLREAEEAEVVIKAAAVADFAPVTTYPGKVKKEEADLVIELKRTPDILAELGRRKRPGQILVGFSAETGGILEHSREKMKRKNLDMVIANDVSRRDSGFASDYNRAWVIIGEGEAEELPLMRKRELARIVLERVLQLRRARET